MLTINLEWDSNALAAPQSFRDGLQAAANVLEAAITDPITVNIAVGYGEYDENGPGYAPLPGGISLGGIDNAVVISYPALEAALAPNDTSAGSAAALSLLPASPSLNGQSTFFVSTALAKAFGALPANDPAIDGYTGFPTDFTGNVLVGAGIVEDLHALGLLNAGGDLGLFAYTSPGVHYVDTGATTATSAYFSLDGGKTDLANYDVGFDDTLFTNLFNDALDVPIQSTTKLSPLDLSEITAIGFNDTSPAVLPAPAFTPVVTASGTPLTVVAQDVSVPENVSIGASSLLQSVSVPAGDVVTSYGFYDTGAAGGYFSIGGVAEPSNTWVYVLDTQLGALHYVGGASAGAETLTIEAVVDTGATNVAQETSAIATTISPAFVVSADYQAILGRSADPAGLAGFVSAVESGTSYTQVATLLANSPEAQTDLHGLYQAELARPADGAGLAGFTQYLAGGGALTGVESLVANSAEAQTDLATLYQAELGRAADPAGLAGFTQYLAGGGALTGVESSVASSVEAQTDLSNLYTAELGRPVDAAGDAAFTRYLAGGGSLAGVQSRVANSPEAQADVSNLLRTDTGSTATASAVAAGQTQLADGLSLGDLNTQTLNLGSMPTEFLAVAGGTTTLSGPGSAVVGFGPGSFGQDAIVGFNPAKDVLELSQSQFPAFATVQTELSQTVNGSMITLDGSDSILLRGVSTASLVPANFRFV